MESVSGPGSLSLEAKHHKHLSGLPLHGIKWKTKGPEVNTSASYFVHERDDLQDKLILSQVVPVFEDDRVHGPVLSFEDQLGRHQSALRPTHTHTESDNSYRICRNATV